VLNEMRLSNADERFVAKPWSLAGSVALLARPGVH
jgi:hypothetical protein